MQYSKLGNFHNRSKPIQHQVNFNDKSKPIQHRKCIQPLCTRIVFFLEVWCIVTYAFNVNIKEMKDPCPEKARIPLRMIEKNMKRQQLCFFLILKSPGFFSSKSCPLHVVIVVVHDCIMHKFNTEQLHFQFLYCLI